MAFQPRLMSTGELLSAHRDLWQDAFSLRRSIRRMLRGVIRLRMGALLMSMAMNGFYAIKALRRNQPVNFERRNDYAEIFDRVRQDMHPSQNDSRVPVSLSELNSPLQTGPASVTN